MIRYVLLSYSFSFFLLFLFFFLFCQSANAEEEQDVLFTALRVYRRELVRNQMLQNYRAEEEIEIVLSVIL
jgi:hypothetical protein